MSDDLTSQSKRVSLRKLLAVGFGARLLVDTIIQSYFSFLPIFALGLGLSLVEMGRLNSVRALSGLIAPLIGAWAERNGYRRALSLSLLTAVVGLVLFTQASAGWLALVAMIAIGAGLGSFIPNLSAYISGQVPYAQRARSFGILELSWGLAGVIGVSVLGIAVDAFGWRIPFMVLAAGLLLAAFMVGRLPPTDRDKDEEEDSAETTHPPKSLLKKSANYFDFGANYRSVWATLLCGSLVGGTTIHFIGTYSAWLFDDYELTGTGLGRVAFALGLAAMLANTLTGTFADRVGSKRTMQIGTFFGSIAFFLIPVLTYNLYTIVATLCVAYLFFELAIVNSFVVLSEQIPSSRAKLMTLGSAFTTVGMSIANISGPWAYETYGVVGIAWPPAVGLVMSFFLLVFIIREQPKGDNNG